jgi:hypothetical protein
VRGREQLGADIESRKEEWLIPCADLFELIMEHPPPRPVSYLHQLWTDAQHWEPWLYFGWAIPAAVFGIAFDNWISVGAAILVFLVYASCVVSVVRRYRSDSVELGVIEGWDPLGNWGSFRTASARLPDGHIVDVALHNKWAANIAGHRGPSEVLFLNSSRGRYQPIIAVRPIQPQAPTGDPRIE